MSDRDSPHILYIFTRKHQILLRGVDYTGIHCNLVLLHNHMNSFKS